MQYLSDPGSSSLRFLPVSLHVFVIAITFLLLLTVQLSMVDFNRMFFFTPGGDGQLLLVSQTADDAKEDDAPHKRTSTFPGQAPMLDKASHPY